LSLRHFGNSYTPANTFVAGFHFTIALLPNGPTLVTHPPSWFKPELVKSDKDLVDEELKTLLNKSLREGKKNKKSKQEEGSSK
jgi:hypothetical protein